MSEKGRTVAKAHRVKSKKEERLNEEVVGHLEG